MIQKTKKLLSGRAGERIQIYLRLSRRSLLLACCHAGFKICGLRYGVGSVLVDEGRNSFHGALAKATCSEALSKDAIEIMLINAEELLEILKKRSGS